MSPRDIYKRENSDFTKVKETGSKQLEHAFEVNIACDGAGAYSSELM